MDLMMMFLRKKNRVSCWVISTKWICSIPFPLMRGRLMHFLALDEQVRIRFDRSPPSWPQIEKSARVAAKECARSNLSIRADSILYRAMQVQRERFVTAGWRNWDRHNRIYHSSHSRLHSQTSSWSIISSTRRFVARAINANIESIKQSTHVRGRVEIDLGRFSVQWSTE